MPYRHNAKATSFSGGEVGLKEHLTDLVSAGGAFLIGESDQAADASTYPAVIAELKLQKMDDFRGAIQAWFLMVEIDGLLVVTVPHAFLFERQHALPSRWELGQRRLYTPRSLLDEVEQALQPNSYRVRALYDDDLGYDYRRSLDLEPIGESSIVLVLQKITPPLWLLGAPSKLIPDAPNYTFEPARTRVEVTRRRLRRRILILKLDHLGDFIMSLPALERARAAFADAHITLVMGSWNVGMASDLGLADEVIPFDVFPRNSTEEEVDVHARAALFQQLPLGFYDLAIDFRCDVDTRFLLRFVKATTKAGIGTRSQFPFLDIFLPVNEHRNEVEAAKEEVLSVDRFAWQGSANKRLYRITSEPDTVERDCAITWGPYIHLRAGNYLFDPYVEFEASEPGMLMMDIALNQQRVATCYVTGPSDMPRLKFNVPGPDMRFEFRIWAIEDTPSLAFSFYGGRLVRQGGASVLHQSEYQLLLLQLIIERLDRQGMLEEATTS